MPKFIYNKLIRDKISELAILDGAKLDFEHITGEKLITQLKKKIREEADEVQEATNNEDLVDELIDLQEIMDTILKNLGIDRETFTARKQAKREKRGWFEKGIYAYSMEVTPDHPRYAYFKKSPHKYPEA